jgi:DNA-binding IclR family transcriptional regulator
LRTDTLLRSLRDALDESVLLAKVNGLAATYLAAFEPSHPLRFLANTKAALRKEIEIGNQRGWFVNREESQQGVTTISARFRWTSSTYIVTVAGPTSRVAPKLEKAAELITNVCNLLGTSKQTDL